MTSGQFQLWIRTARGGPIIGVEVSADATIGDVVDAAHAAGLPSSSKLTFGGRPLFNLDALLSDEGIGAESSFEEQPMLKFGRIASGGKIVFESERRVKFVSDESLSAGRAYVGCGNAKNVTFQINQFTPQFNEIQIGTTDRASESQQIYFRWAIKTGDVIKVEAISEGNRVKTIKFAINGIHCEEIPAVEGLRDDDWGFFVMVSYYGRVGDVANETIVTLLD